MDPKRDRKGSMIAPALFLTLLGSSFQGVADTHWPGFYLLRSVNGSLLDSVISSLLGTFIG